MATEPQAKYLSTLVQSFPVPAAERGLIPETTREEMVRTGMRGNIAHDHLDALVGYARKSWPWKPASKQSFAAELAYQHALRNGYTAIGKRHYDALVREAKEIGFQRDDFLPLHFQRNGEDGRGRISISETEAIEVFRKGFSAVRKEVNKRLDPNNNDLLENDEDDEIGEDEIRENLQNHEEKKEREKVPGSKEFRLFYENAYLMCEDKRDQTTGESFDAIGMRSGIDGAKMLIAGVPVNIVKANLCQHWGTEIKRAIWGLTEKYTPQNRQTVEPWDYDVSSYKADVDLIPGAKFVTDRHHDAIHLALTYAHNRQPFMLWGPSGTGKTTIAKHMSEVLGKALGRHVEFGFLSMTRATSPSAFNGRPKINNTALMVEFLSALADGNAGLQKELAKRAKAEGDVAMSIWQRLYQHGGVMLLDEIDAGDENLILLVNAAIANNKFANTATGEVIDQHPDFVICFAGNTNGMGATRHHGARNRLDHATLDRVRMGRIHVTLDLKLALRTYDDMIEAAA